MPKRQTHLRFTPNAESKTPSRPLVARRSANYQPSLWEHEYLLSLGNTYVKENNIERVNILKQEVSKMLTEMEGLLEKLELVDILQRLGVSYHFEREIKNILTNVHVKNVRARKNRIGRKRWEDLYATALKFRLLRQHGFSIAQDVFDGNFGDGLDDEGIKSVLSLYEASYLSTGSDTKLKETIYFTRKRLRNFVKMKKSETKPYVRKMVIHALEMPYHQRVGRLEARWYIDVYGERHDMNPILLEFAKLDYNIVQGIHQDELKYLSRTSADQYEEFLRSTRSTHDVASGSQSRTPSMVMESPPARAPAEISIEDFVSQDGRDRLPKLHPERIDGATWFEDSHNGITKAILRMMQGLLKKPYEKFSIMPSEEQEIWFKQFAQEFNWHRDHTTEVRRRFKEVAARHYSKTLNEWKRRWSKGKQIKGINDEVYKGLKEYWVQPTTQKISSTASQNRRSERGGKGMAVQNAGATSFFSRAEQLTQRDGVPPDYLTLMEDTHTNKKTGQIQDPVIREVIENARKKKEELILTQQSQASIDGSEPPTTVPREVINQIVLEETPKRKGRIFGLGNLGIFGSSSCYSSPSARDVEIQKALAEKDERIAALEKMMEEEKAANQRRDEEAKRREEAAKLREEKMQKFMDDMLARFPSSSS